MGTGQVWRVEWRCKQLLYKTVFQADGLESGCSPLIKILLVIPEKMAKLPMDFALLCPWICSMPTWSPHSCLCPTCFSGFHCIDVPTPTFNPILRTVRWMPSPGKLEMWTWWFEFSIPWKVVSYEAQAFLCGLLTAKQLEGKDQPILNVLSPFQPQLRQEEWETLTELERVYRNK